MRRLISSSSLYKLPQDILYGQSVKSKVHCLRGPTKSILTEDAVYCRSDPSIGSGRCISVPWVRKKDVLSVACVPLNNREEGDCCRWRREPLPASWEAVGLSRQVVSVIRPGGSLGKWMTCRGNCRSNSNRHHPWNRWAEWTRNGGYALILSN